MWNFSYQNRPSLFPAVLFLTTEDEVNWQLMSFNISLPNLTRTRDCEMSIPPFKVHLSDQESFSANLCIMGGFYSHSQRQNKWKEMILWRPGGPIVHMTVECRESLWHFTCTLSPAARAKCHVFTTCSLIHFTVGWGSHIKLTEESSALSGQRLRRCASKLTVFY